MCGRLSTALSSLPDKQSPSISRFRPLEGSSAQDQQTFAASNTLCAMRYYQSPAICESGYFSSEADGGFHGLHTSSLLGPAQNASWSGSQPWAETTFSSPAPCQGDSWSFDATSHPTNGSPCRQYPVLPSYVSPGYAVPTRALFSATERMTKSSQMQRPTPPPETFVESPYGHAATLPSMEPTSPFPANPGSQPEAELMDSSTATVDHSSMSKDQTNDVPYAKLIERALLEAKGNRLVLKDIYRWFEQNTNKADDTAFKGWQNSVRHNLSMNGAFRKVPLPPSSDKSQKGCLWVLDPSAKEHGIQSTTRYRRKDDSKRFGKKSIVNSLRDCSNRRGSCAIEKAAKVKKRSLLIGQKPSSLQSTMADNHQLHGRSYVNPLEKQSPAPPFHIPLGHAQPYLPSPPYRPSSSNDDCSELDGDYACMPLETAMPLSPCSQLYRGLVAPPVLMSSVVHQPMQRHSGSYF